MALEWKWLRNDLDDPLESNSFAALKIAFGDHVITRLYDRVSGGERDTVNVPLYSLALCIADNWWTLLYEPRKSHGDPRRIESRHYLDACVRGFIFPAVSIWSAGDDAISMETPYVRDKHSSLEFFQQDSQTIILPRVEFEQNLFSLVTSIVERVCKNHFGTQLREAWDRVLTSLGNEDERKYCLSAGRVGVDPYDPDSVDISEFACKLPEQLFADICEAATIDELSSAAGWAKENGDSMQKFPQIDIAAFGMPPTIAPSEKAWDIGYKAARILRQRLGLEGIGPRRVVDHIFGAAVRADAQAATGTQPLAVEGIVSRENGTSRVAVPKVPARLRRSTLCRGAYRAWRANDGDYSAVTSAATREQQASRAFAAELLAPADWLREQAGTGGLTESSIEAIAKANICPEQTVIWQAHNHGIPMRGIQI